MAPGDRSCSQAKQSFRRWRQLSEEGYGMSYGLYIAGFVIIISGLIYGAVLLHLPPQWIVVGSVVLLGIAIVKGVKATRQKDPVK
jgi:hypothetical protein